MVDWASPVILSSIPVVTFPKSVAGILGNSNRSTVYFDSVERLNTIGLPKEFEGVHAYQLYGRGSLFHWVCRCTPLPCLLELGRIAVQTQPQIASIYMTRSEADFLLLNFIESLHATGRLS